MLLNFPAKETQQYEHSLSCILTVREYYFKYRASVNINLTQVILP